MSDEDTQSVYDNDNENRLSDGNSKLKTLNHKHYIRI